MGKAQDTVRILWERGGAGSDKRVAMAAEWNGLSRLRASELIGRLLAAAGGASPAQEADNNEIGGG